jgi:hypothetical protein
MNVFFTSQLRYVTIHSQIKLVQIGEDIRQQTVIILHRDESTQISMGDTAR